MEPSASAMEAETDVAKSAARRLSPELESVILEVARSERELDSLLDRFKRLHESNIAHNPMSCLVCFGSR